MKKLLIGIVVVLGGLAAVVSRQPDDFQVTRSAVIMASPSTVFSQVNDLHKWGAWDPWAKLDPESKTTFEGPAAGLGASMSWSGNSKVGQGRMTITESKASERIGLQLDFVKPMKATNQVEFTFKSDGSQTLVTWSMSGKNSFVAKAMGLVMNFEKMLGGQFEQGLSQLKAVSEASIKKS